MSKKLAKFDPCLYISPTTKRANPSSGNWLLRSHVKTKICRFLSSVCFGQWSDKKLCVGSSGCCSASKKRCEKQNELENRLTRISIVVPKSSSFVLQPDMGCPNFPKQQQRDEMKWAEKKRLWKDFNKSEWILVLGQSVTRWHSPFAFSLNSLFSFFLSTSIEWSVETDLTLLIVEENSLDLRSNSWRKKQWISHIFRQQTTSHDESSLNQNAQQ